MKSSSRKMGSIFNSTRCSPEKRSGVHEIGYPVLDHMNIASRKQDRLDTSPNEVSAQLQSRSELFDTDGFQDIRVATGRLTDTGQPFLPRDTILEPISRKPVVLPESTRLTVYSLPVGSRCRLTRLASFDVAVRSSSPRVSIVVITRDNFVFSKLCLESVVANTDYPNYELIVVDNGSTNELLTYLDQLADRLPFVRVFQNERNLGFAVATNQGLSQADGDRFVLLNNDTIVPPGWLTPLIRRLDDPQVGAVGPVTNRIGNEAQIETSYRSYGEFKGLPRNIPKHARESILKFRCSRCFASRLPAKPTIEWAHSMSNIISECSKTMIMPYDFEHKDIASFAPKTYSSTISGCVVP